MVFKKKEKKVKKIISRVLVVFMMLGSVISTNADTASTNRTESFRGSVISEFNAKNNYSEKTLDDAIMYVDEFGFTNNNEFVLSGNVDSDSWSDEFVFSGSFVKSAMFDNAYVAKVNDKNDNFDILYFAVSEKVQKDRLRIKKKFENKNVLQMYLQNKKTKEILIFEVKVNKKNMFFSFIKKAQTLDIKTNKNMSEEHWWVLVGNPSINSREIKMERETSRLYYNSFDTTTASYSDGFGHVYKYELDAKLLSTVCDHSAHKADIFKIIFEEERFYYNNRLIEGQTGLKMKNIIAKVDLGAGNVDNIHTFMHGGIYTERTGGLQSEFNASIGYTAGPIGYSLSWSPINEIPVFGKSVSFAESEHVKSFKMPFEGQLTKEDDFISFTVEKYDAQKTYAKGINARVTFDVAFDMGRVIDSCSLYVEDEYN